MYFRVGWSNYSFQKFIVRRKCQCWKSFSLIWVKAVERFLKNKELKKKLNVAKLYPHNFNNRINWQKQINKELGSKIKLLSRTASKLEEENVKFKKGLENVSKDKTKLSRSYSYLKKIVKWAKKTQILIKMLLSLKFMSYVTIKLF